MNKYSLEDVFEAAGVIATLAFVAIEIRLNTSAVRSSVIQSMTEQTQKTQAIFLSNIDLRTAFRARIDGTHNADQRIQINVFYQMALHISINRFEHMKNGTIERNFVRSIGANIVFY